MNGEHRHSRLSGKAAAEAAAYTQEAADLCHRALLVRGKYKSCPEIALDEEDLRLVARALEMNGEEYSLWNFRREMMVALMEGRRKIRGNYAEGGTKKTVESVEGTETERREEDSLEERWRRELDLTKRALMKMPKAYGSWSYRLFLLGFNGIDKGLKEDALKKELGEVEAMLRADPRNFHGWAHRMRVKALIDGESKSMFPRKTDLLAELNYVVEKINQDFANYSAWHHRSRVLSTIHVGATDFIKDELELVREGFYTEPEVQSTWFYHRWLLAGAPARGVAIDPDRDLWESELETCNSLLKIEPHAKFALLTKALLSANLNRTEDAKQAYRTLIELDPLRKGFYKYNLRKLD